MTKIQNQLPKYKILLLVIFAAILGSVFTVGSLKIFEQKNIAKSIKSESFQNLSNLLIEIESYISSGVNSDKLTELARQFSVTSNQYKLSHTLKDEELTLLNYISSGMNLTISIWKIDVGDYSCFGGSPRDECIRNYSAQLYKILSITDKTEEEFSKGFLSGFKEKKGKLEDYKSDLVSFELGLISTNIKAFFKYHNKSL